MTHGAGSTTELMEETDSFGFLNLKVETGVAKSRVSILAAAESNIQLPAALLSRFDLLWLI